MTFSGDFYAKSDGEKTISDWGKSAGATPRQIKTAQNSMRDQLAARGYTDGAAYHISGAWDGSHFTVTVS